MKKFILETLKFFTPILLIILFIILNDPFKIWFSYDDYFKDYFVTLNREDMCLKLYNKGKDVYHFNSFILGSSRSHAFKTSIWKKYIGPSAIPFHFDASGEGIYGILNKLRYLDDLNAPINNALIILDESCMRKNFNRQGHLFISPPTLSKESKFEYNKTFIVACLNPKFIFAYFDYKLSKRHKEYMGSLISKFIPQGNNINADIFYWSYNMDIKNDSLSYYSNLIKKGVFYNRTMNNIIKNQKMTDIEKNQLKEIYEILKKHETKFKIVISPLYNQIPLSSERLTFLESLFGKKNVYNFSGKNQLTEPIGNYFENSHYRPHVANEIMSFIYGNKTREHTTN